MTSPDSLSSMARPGRWRPQATSPPTRWSAFGPEARPPEGDPHDPGGLEGLMLAALAAESAQLTLELSRNAYLRAPTDANLDRLVADSMRALSRETEFSLLWHQASPSLLGRERVDRP